MTCRWIMKSRRPQFSVKVITFIGQRSRSPWPLIVKPKITFKLLMLWLRLIKLHIKLCHEECKTPIYI